MKSYCQHVIKVSFAVLSMIMHNHDSHACGIKLTIIILIINKIIFINKSPAHFYKTRLQLKSLDKNKEKVKHSIY